MLLVLVVVQVVPGEILVQLLEIFLVDFLVKVKLMVKKVRTKVEERLAGEVVQAAI